jgi:hypothetical protein
MEGLSTRFDPGAIGGKSIAKLVSRVHHRKGSGNMLPGRSQDSQSPQGNDPTDVRSGSDYEFAVVVSVVFPHRHVRSPFFSLRRPKCVAPGLSVCRFHCTCTMGQSGNRAAGSGCHSTLWPHVSVHFSRPLAEPVLFLLRDLPRAITAGPQCTLVETCVCRGVSGCTSRKGNLRTLTENRCSAFSDLHGYWLRIILWQRAVPSRFLSFD